MSRSSPPQEGFGTGAAPARGALPPLVCAGQNTASLWGRVCAVGGRGARHGMVPVRCMLRQNKTTR